MTIVLQPYFPNSRLQYVKNDDRFFRGFDWFMCGIKYYDDDIKGYVVSLPKGCLLLHEPTGTTYETVLDKTLIVLSESAPLSGIYHGRASSKGCAVSVNPVWCRAVSIEIVESAVKRHEGECELTAFARRHNSCLRKRNESFPSANEVSKCDSALLVKQLNDFFSSE